MGFRVWPACIAVALTSLIWFFIAPPEGVTPQAWQLLALFVGVIAAIIGKAMPIGAISIIAIILVAITQVTSSSSDAAIADALSSFANPLIWLIGVAIMISRGLLKTGLGARIGYLFIAAFGKTTLGIGYSLALSELILAPVTPSNTARGGGIIHPIMLAIASSFDSDPEKNTQGLVGRYLALVNYQSNPITSAMFVTATAPNPLVVSLIAEVTYGDLQISWGMWAVAMLVPGLVALAIMPLVVYLLYPPEIKKTPDASAMARQQLKDLGPISRDEWIMLFVFGLMLILWAGIPAMLLGPAWMVNATTTAFIGLGLLLLSKVLTWDDVLKEKSAWDTIIWFGALVMMATQLNKSGLLAVMTDWLTQGIDGLGAGWVMGSLLLVAVYLYAHYMFASTTAHITAMFAAFFAAGLYLGAPPILFALLLAAASSLMMTLTHYATGTSPIIFGSNFTTLGQWWKTGFVMSVANLIVFVLVGGLWWKVLGYW